MKILRAANRSISRFLHCRVRERVHFISYEIHWTAQLAIASQRAYSKNQLLAFFELL